MVQRHHLNEGEKGSIIGSIKRGNKRYEYPSRVWSRFLSNESVDRQPGQGRPRATIASEERFLSMSAQRNCEVTARDLVLELHPTTATRISSSAAARRLNKVGLYARKPMACVPFTPASRGARLN
ncbi:hypothetical protein X975_17720, partial [Stegodyphus mimosarum]